MPVFRTANGVTSRGEPNLSTGHGKDAGTFRANRDVPIHRWYPYTEGYGASFVQSELELLDGNVQHVYDPFGGSGTTALVSAQLGLSSSYSETNPFMAFVTEIKINGAIAAQSKWPHYRRALTKAAENIEEGLPPVDPSDFLFYERAFRGSNFFRDDVLKEILAVKTFASQCEPLVNQFVRFALGCVLVRVSNMVRRADLRYARDVEKTDSDWLVRRVVSTKLRDIVEDLESREGQVLTPTRFVGPDARVATFDRKIDAIVTSPPYLNGTNYIRNSKLELWILDFVKSAGDLHRAHGQGITAGINGVSARMGDKLLLPAVKPYVTQLQEVAYDRRIPTMVAAYFSDMDSAFMNWSRYMSHNGYLVLDIGDSQFAGVHIPTHKLLEQIARSRGFTLYGDTLLRSRRSKNGTTLTQRVLRFRFDGK